MRQKRTVPKGTSEIRVPDRWFPEKLHLVGARNKTHVFFFRRQEDWHYPVPLTDLVGGSEFTEGWKLIEEDARKAGELPRGARLSLISRHYAERADRAAEEIFQLVRVRAVAEKLAAE